MNRWELLLILAKAIGKLISVLARTQTRLLSKAQFLGWQPTDHESAKLIRRQYQLFNYDMAKKMKRQQGGFLNKKG